MGVTLDVGPAQTYTTIAAAESASHDGDTIQIHADGSPYHEAVTWHANGLTVVGVGGHVVLDMTGMTIGNGKAIFVSAGSDETFADLEFTGAAVTDQNGAGIRWEGGGALAVHGCVFRSNENGILGGGAQTGHPENTALVEGNEFVDNGRGKFGYTHSVYFGDAASVTFRANWSHSLYPGGTDIGHLFKSRAHQNYVLYNRLTAEDTWSSYEIDIPQGGDAYVIGNLIQQKMGSQRTMIMYGDTADGTQYTPSTLRVVNNTFVSEATGGPATFIHSTNTDAQITATNNLTIGDGTLISGGIPTMTNNIAGVSTDLVDAAHYDYHLAASVAEIDAGIDPGVGLAPDSEYVQPQMTTGRGIAGSAIDVGAYEHGNPGGAVVDGGQPVDMPGDNYPVDMQSTKSGGCCDAGTASTSFAPFALVGLLALRRRRSRTPSRASASSRR